MPDQKPAHQALQRNRPIAASNSLLDVIYQSALRPKRIQDLHDQFHLHITDDQNPGNRAKLNVLYKHMQRALRLRSAYSSMQRERLQLAQIIDAIAPPIIVIDAEQNVLGLNDAARAPLLNSSYLKRLF